MSKVNELFKQELKIVNMGLKSFAEDLKKQKVAVLHVDWRPPAGGNQRMIELLGRLRDKK
ncbi:MAG: fdrA domain protein [Bacillota bacterium]